MGEAHVGVRRSVIWLDSDSLLVGGDGIGILLKPVPGEAHPAVRLSVIWLDGNSLLVGVDGLCVLPKLVAGVAHVVVRLSHLIGHFCKSWVAGKDRLGLCKFTCSPTQIAAIHEGTCS